MPWWGWLVIGALLFGSEMFVVDAQFYLVFFGAAAAVVGLIGLMGIALPEWGQWLAFAALSIVAMVGFRDRIYTKVRKRGGSVEAPLQSGDRVGLMQPLEPGKTCRVEYRGSTWTARNVDQTTLAGDVEIVRVDGLTLHVRRTGS
jgi:membrane protein implicated in regulation of membrane protease activity